MKGNRALRRQAVLRRMLELAVRPANDAVKLAYLSENERESIDTLDLGCLTEFKRSGNGGVEIRLADRAAVLEKLLDRMGEDEAGATAFLQALEREAPAPQPLRCSER